MASQSGTSTTFLHAYSPRKNLLGIVARPDSLSNDYQYTRFYSCYPFDDSPDEWAALDYKFDTKSLLQWVIPEKNYKAWWLLGKNGEAMEVIKGKSRTEQIPGAGLHGNANDLGYVERIKVIGEDLYVCGLMRQVYKRNGGQWDLISGDILLESKTYPRGFTDIEGFDEKNIYVVGDHGEVFFYDGHNWYQEDFKTNAHLHVITPYSSQKMLVAGSFGIVGLGYHDHWQLFKFDQPIEGIDEDDLEGRDWWGAAVYNDTVYLTGDQGIWTLDIETEEFSPVNIPIKKDYSSHQLFASEGYLWSLGGKDILVFDGETWQEIICADNE